MSTVNKSWRKLFDKYNIEQEIIDNGYFHITAKQIKEFKEPRLMTKFDSKGTLPELFKPSQYVKYSILPVTRGEYVIAPMDLYQEIPLPQGKIEHIPVRFLDSYETINIDNITSEAAAINVMSISGLLDDFLEEDNMVQTVSGRMGSGEFSFNVNHVKGIKSPFNPYSIDVLNSQIEIDGGFENHNVFSIIEAKNVVHSDFLIRQLYYPFRCWKNRIDKPIRTVFMVYSNKVYRLLEYRFEVPNNYSSIQLIKEKRYSFEDVDIFMKDIVEVYNNIVPCAEDDDTPFVQADKFDKVISLLENLMRDPLTCAEIAILFGFRDRQSDYYFNACKYLGLAYKEKCNDGKKRVFISEKGKQIMKLPYKQRQLSFIREILSHEIFREIFEVALRTGEIPEKKYIEKRLEELHIVGSGTSYRRNSSVSGWVNWIFAQNNE